MDEYRKILILQYFLNKKEYDINDIVKELGISYKRVIKLINNLIIDKMLKYNNYLLELTKKGKKHIEKNDIYFLNDKTIITDNISIKSRMKLDDIYLPKRFSKKI